jgi:hypothetical protein
VDVGIFTRPLSEIAADSGFTMADVAFLAGLQESTVSRLWDNPDWFDKITGRSLKALIGVLPGVVEYTYAHSLQTRRSRLIEELSSQGVSVNPRVLRHLVTELRIPEQYLSNALESAGHVLRGDVRASAAHLMRFWGREQDSVLGVLFDSDPDKNPLSDPGRFIEASIDVANQLATKTNSFHAMVAQANVAHHVARTQGRTLDDIGVSGRQSALVYRSSTIGLILRSDDVSHVREYAHQIEKSRLLAMVEDWAFPTFARDARPSTDFTLPRSLMLSETADEVLSEISSYNTAYLYYLVTVYLPRALRRDPTFGLRSGELNQRLAERMATVEDTETLKACEAFLRTAKQQGTGSR